MDRQELGNSPILTDPELPPDFVWSVQTQLSSQYRPLSVSFSTSVICNPPDDFSDNCTWPRISQPESIYAPAVERRWTSREQPDIHSTAAQWPFSGDESAVHFSSQNGPGSNSFRDDYASPFLSSRYQDMYEQASRDLDHLAPDSESASCSRHGQPLPVLTTAYQDLYERTRSELDNYSPSDQSDSSNGLQPSSSSRNDSRNNLERDSRQGHQLFAPGDFPEEEDSSGSDSTPEQAPYCDSGYDDSVSGDHRPEVNDQGVILHPHQPGAMYRCDIEQVLLLEVIQVVPQIEEVQASQTSQVDLTLNGTACECCSTQGAIESSLHSFNSSSTCRLSHEHSIVSNGHFTENINLRSFKDTAPATQEHEISPIIIRSDRSDRQDVSTSTSSDSNSVAFFPPQNNTCSITLSSQRCHFGDDMTKMVLSAKENSGIDGVYTDSTMSYTPPESIFAKRAHSEIEADDEATFDGFPDTGRGDRMQRRKSRVRRSRRDRNEIRIINGINRHIQEPCNKLLLPKRKRSLSPSQMDVKRRRADVDGYQWPPPKDVRAETNDCHRTQTSRHATGSKSDSDRSIRKILGGPESSALQSRKRKPKRSNC
ncbi:dentin sialophosphoprotein-like [Haliotis asinina]|uniref:dentin sialophosphoprotein-like n=1 Tax=Haliotis asinina TaxID=109174 RepID=UPI003531F44B